MGPAAQRGGDKIFYLDSLQPFEKFQIGRIGPRKSKPNPRKSEENPSKIQTFPNCRIERLRAEAGKAHYMRVKKVTLS
jgi:hypothetical protein